MKRILKEISRKQNLEVNLPRFASEFASLYYRFAYVHFSLNYYGYYEVLTEEQKESAQDARSLLSELNTVIRRVMLPGVCGEELVEAVAGVDALRHKVIDTMKVLTAYTDLFNLYEHVLNRVEYRFRDASYPENYSDEEFCSRLMRYIVSEEDNMMMNLKILNVIRQLPVRMTKSRFFEQLKAGLSVYENNAMEGLEDFLYMVRTSAALDRPEGMEQYRELQEIAARLRETDYGTLDAEQYEELNRQMQYAADFLKESVDLYVQLADLMNDVYTILLMQPYAAADEEEIAVCRQIVQLVCRKLEDGASGSLGETALEQLIDLEGRQEYLREQYEKLEYYLDEILTEEGDLLKSLAIDAEYRALKRAMLLESGSQFVELDRQEQSGDSIALAADIEERGEALIAELTDLFAGNHRKVNRAVMSAVLAELPVFFNNLQELQDYIYETLKNCRDEAEKLACVELLEAEMKEMYDKE